MNIFTPVDRKTGDRLSLMVDKEVPRGYRWKRTFKDEKGKTWKAWGKSCGIPSCFCDAYTN